jgi:hypothetical protein
MKKIIYSFTLIYFIASLQSCNLFGPTRPTITNEQYKIKVDSIVLPYASVFSNDTLVIGFLGTIGTDSCYKFDHFEGTQGTHQIDLVLWGLNYRTSNDICHTGVISLSGKQYHDYPISSGDYTVIVHQPDGTLKQRTIHIYP